MSRIIFDIETAGQDFFELQPEIAENLIKWIDSKEELSKIGESLSFYPQTGEIIAIGLLNPETSKGAVYYQSKNPAQEDTEIDGIAYKAMSEADILVNFWTTVNKYDRIITFNGRGFDCPFILARSAVHNIRPTRELMPNRFSDSHIDLFDRLTFYGVTKKRFGMDVWCRSLGIKSPKSEGITGYDVKDLYKAEKCLEIAKYCAGDIFATRDLLFKWERYMNYPPAKGS